MLRVSVVEVALTGLCIEFVSVVVVVLWEVCTGTSLTVVQAVSATKAAAARHEMMSVFIVGICCLDCYLSVVVVVFFSLITDVDAGVTMAFLTMTFEATILSPSLM